MNRNHSDIQKKSNYGQFSDLDVYKIVAMVMKVLNKNLRLSVGIHTDTHLPDVLPRPLQNHFLLVLQ